MPYVTKVLDQSDDTTVWKNTDTDNPEWKSELKELSLGRLSSYLNELIEFIVNFYIYRQNWHVIKNLYLRKSKITKKI